MDSKITRRGFLIALTGSAMAAAVGCRPNGLVVPTVYAPGSATDANNPPTAVKIVSVADAPLDTHYGQVKYDKIFTTTTDNLYDTQYDYNNTPSLNAADWKLQIDGLVDNPMTLVYEAVKELPAYEEMRTIECIGNPVGGGLIGNVLWRGFHLEDILSKIGVKTEATHAKFEAADGYSTSVEMKWITQPNVMMAYMMNGAPLTQVHGFPLRIMMPGLYGQKMPRWIQHIQFINQDYIGFWEGNGYSNLATVKTNSIIQSPNGNSHADPLEAGRRVAIQGVAYGAPRLITKVEVRIDSGDWMPAQIVNGPNKLTWTQWYINWVPNAPGSYQIAVRATDDTGFVQTHENAGIFGDNARDGTDAIHSINVQAVTPTTPAATQAGTASANSGATPAATKDANAH